MTARKPGEGVRDFVRRLAIERTPTRADEDFARSVAAGRANSVLEGWEPDEIDDLLLAMLSDGRLTRREATELGFELSSQRNDATRSASGREAFLAMVAEEKEAARLRLRERGLAETPKNLAEELAMASLSRLRLLE